MNIISTRVHGLIDYMVSLFIILSPWILNYSIGGYESWVPVAIGVSTVLYSLFTDYEYGMFKVISMRNHLTLDFIAALALIASPWVIGFHHYVYLPHVIIGIVEIAVTLLTSHFTSYHIHKGNWRMDTEQGTD